VTNVTELHRQLFGTEDYEPSATVQEYNNIIINETGMTTEKAVNDEFNDGDDFTGTGQTDDGGEE
jgi:hypothetical protein